MDSTAQVLVLLGEIREEIGGLRADVRNSDRRFDQLDKALATHILEDVALTARVSQLEHSRTKIKTVATVVSAIVSGAFALVLAVVKGAQWAH